VAKDQSTKVLMFGTLYTLQKARGLSPSIEISLRPEGRKAGEIAGDLNLPVELIGGIYCNHLASDLNQVVRPGDRLAFVPRSVPGPHRCFFGFPTLEQVPPGQDVPEFTSEGLQPVVGPNFNMV